MANDPSRIVSHFGVRIIREGKYFLKMRQITSEVRLVAFYRLC